MTKLRWEKADRYEQDPARVNEVPESTRPSNWLSPQEREKRNAERARERREAEERSKEHDRKLAIARSAAGALAKLERGEPLNGFERIFLKKWERANR